MIRLEVFGESGTMTAVAQLLDGNPGISHLRVADAMRPGQAGVLATVDASAVDGLLKDLRGLGVPEGSVIVSSSEQAENRLGRARRHQPQRVMQR